MNKTVVISQHLLILGKHKLAPASEFWKLELPLILLSVPHKDVLAEERRVQVHAHLGSPRVTVRVGLPQGWCWGLGESRRSALAAGQRQCRLGLDAGK